MEYAIEINNLQKTYQKSKKSLPQPLKAFIEAYLAVPVNFLLFVNLICCPVLLLLNFLAKP